MTAGGHIFEDDGRKIDTIVDTLNSSKDNLIIEEFDVFTHNNYDVAAREIIDEAWKRIHDSQGNLAFRAVKLHMLRRFKRGKRTYIEED